MEFDIPMAMPSLPDVPLPIDNNTPPINEDNEDTVSETEKEIPIKNEYNPPSIVNQAPPVLKSEPETKTQSLAINNLSPPPLPLNDDTDNDNTDSKPKQETQPHSSQYYPPPSPHRSPPKFMPSHLRAPPPLTPMSSIGNDGTVINASLPPAVEGHSSEYMMPPPPRPVLHSQPSYAIEYNCNLCRLAFNTKSECVSHKANVHGQGRDEYDSRIESIGGGAASRRPRYFCNVCGRSFTGKQHFEYHMRTHSGEKPFKCQQCGKAFRAKHSLKNHIRIHTGERPYQCKVCGKWFRQLGVMKNHIRNMHSH